MLQRLLGQEMEYAFRVTAKPGHKRPSHQILYQAITQAMELLVVTRPGRRVNGFESIFTENGGAFCYEFLPRGLRVGLLEGSTPECRGPSELLLYQKAQERLLVEAMTLAQRQGIFHGQAICEEIGLLKNCRDQQGRIYGAQENYEVELASGGWLWLYRAGLVALLPAILLVTVLSWLLLLVMVLVVLLLVPPLFGAMILGELSPKISGAITRVFDEEGLFDRWILTLGEVLERVLATPTATAFALLLRAVAFRRVRRGALGFLVTRSVMTGAGSLERSGAFALSEKGLALREVMRSHGGSHSRSIFDTGNLLKGLLAPVALQLRPLLALLGRRQRLQLGMSDANMAQVAEYLKVGTTCLVIDMAEAGFLEEAPRPRRPVEAVGAVVRDPTLTVKVALRGDEARDALWIQRWYLERARAFLAQSSTPSLEATEVVRLWGECLDALGQDPGVLVGRLDWVTKRWLLEETVADEDWGAKKKVDLKYHELGCGYFAQLEAEGLAPKLVSDEEAFLAMREPPERTPARLRGRLIRELGRDQQVTVNWSSIRVGGHLGRVGGKVIRLDDYRGDSSSTD